MPTFTFFHEFKKFLGDGTIDLDTHTFKVALTNVAPNVLTDDQLADITQAGGAGYVVGGYALTSVQWLETGPDTGIWRFNAADLLIQASGGPINDFRYLVFYDDTPAGDPLMGYLDYGLSIVLPDSVAILIDIGSNGIFELS